MEVDQDLFEIQVNRELQFLRDQLREKDRQIKFLEETIKNIWREKNEDSN